MPIPEYIKDWDNGDDIRDVLNLAIHRALYSLHKWEQGHDGDYSIHGQKIWWFNGAQQGANRNDEPGGTNSNNNGSWISFTDGLVTDAALQAFADTFVPQGVSIGRGNFVAMWEAAAANDALMLWIVTDELQELNGRLYVRYGDNFGPPMSPVSSGSDSTESFIAGAVIGGDRVVVVDSGYSALVADSSDQSHAGQVVGISTGAVQLGETISPKHAGPIEITGANFDPGEVFFDSNGVLTSTPPSSGFRQAVGIATSPTRMIVNISEAEIIE